MQQLSKPAFPLIAGLILGALAASVAFTSRSPATWEECMAQKLDTAHTDKAVTALSMFCNAYPRRSKDAS